MPNIQNKTVQTADRLTRQLNGSIQASSFNKEKRTVDVIFATDRPVLMGYWERYYEILSFEDGHVRMQRLNSGAPLLDGHNRWTKAAELPGVVEKAWIDGNKGYATVRFSKNEDGQKLMEQVEDGIVRNVSFGYTVYGYEEIDSAGSTTSGQAKDNKIPTYRAIDWEGNEISFVTIPADIDAGVRELNEDGSLKNVRSTNIPIKNLNDDNMKVRFQRDAGGAGEQGGGAAPAPAAAPAAPGAEQNRGSGAAPTPAPTPAAAPAAPAADGGNSRGMFGEMRDFVSACRAANLTEEEQNDVVEKATDMNHARQLILEKMAARSQEHAPASGNRSAVVGGDTERKTRIKAMEDYIISRAMPSLLPDGVLPEPARQYLGMNLREMARDCVEVALGPGAARGMTVRELTQNALNVGEKLYRGAMSTSDFPIALGNVADRILLAAYNEQPSEWRQLSAQKNATDFKAMTMVRTGEGDNLERVLEGGEYKRGTFSEVGDTHRVYKYGKIVAVTWESLVNDDLGIFNDILPQYARAARRTQDAIFWEMFLGGANNLGAKMYDNKQMFDAAHNNSATGSTIDIDKLGLARKLMRKQKDIDGKSTLNITPNFLIVGPDKEQLAYQYTSNNYTPDSPGGQNPWAGKLKTIVESRMDDYVGKAWYLATSPNQFRNFIHSFLEGESELFSERRTGFEIDGLEIKVRMVFGTKAVDWRGLVRNPGE